jgi:chromate reductase
MARDVVVLVGSLRKESYSRRVARVLMQVAPTTLALRFVEIGSLEYYNQDLETATPPANWVAFRHTIRRANAVLFVTPEYNRSVPGVLKNAIDVGSRPKVNSVWENKPAGVVSVAPSAISGFGANHHLRQMLVWLNMPALQQPEAYVGNVDKRFNAAGELTDESTREFLRKFMEAFSAWIEKLSS